MKRIINIIINTHIVYRIYQGVLKIELIYKIDYLNR